MLGFIGYRHRQVLLLFGGMICSFSARANLSIAVVSMLDNSTNSGASTFDWDSRQKGALLGMIFFGYVVGTVPAGFLVNKFSPRLVLSATGILGGLVNLAFPVIAIQLGYYASCVSRFISGLLQGAVVPGIFALNAKWALPVERGRFLTLILSGNPFGSGLMLSTGGLIAASPFGWPGIFYVSGIVQIFWSVLCFWLVVDSPREHTKMTENELFSLEDYINASKGESEDLPIPFISIFLSIRLWASIIGVFGFLWGYCVLLTMIPTYMNDVLHFDVAQNGLLSALPYLGMFITSLVFPVIAAITERYCNLPLVFHRKLWSSVALFGGAIAFTVLAIIEPQANVTLVILVIATTLGGGVFSGPACNVLDLTTNFAGVASGLQNGISNLASILAPIITGFMLVDATSVAEWKIVFWTSAVVYFVTNTVFLIFASAQREKWDRPRAVERQKS